VSIPPVSIIIPTLNEGDQIAGVLARLQPLRARGHEVLLVDGGSSDTTIAQAGGLADRILDAPRGRASQMLVGAAFASHDVLWFLHADTWVPDRADELITAALQRAPWGRFDIRLSGRHRRPVLRLVEWMMNRRSCLTGIATGDQGIFVTRQALDAVGGMPPLPLMEDVELSRRLRRFGRPACIAEPLITSSRRWEQRGVWRTIALMWLLRAAYALGVSPRRLARLYR
jgi:rSAM/selenodomain-associated transferase 2